MALSKSVCNTCLLDHCDKPLEDRVSFDSVAKDFFQIPPNYMRMWSRFCEVTTIFSTFSFQTFLAKYEEFCRVQRTEF